MSTPNWHWSKQPNAEKVKAEVVKHLKPNYWEGKKRSPEVIQKLNEGKKRWREENPDDYRVSCFKATRHLVGEGNPNWKGGRRVQHGYVMLLSKNHPRADRHGYVREHRLVMEKHLGRYLERSEVVDHINGIKDDNRIENLRLFSKHSDHIKAEWERDSFKTRKPQTIIKCQVCTKEFAIKPYQIGKTKYCSRDCLNKSKIGKPSWNAGKKLDRSKYPSMGNFKKTP